MTEFFTALNERWLDFYWPNAWWLDVLGLMALIVLFIVALLVMIGFGMALIGGPQQAAALKSWPRDRAGSASGTYSFMRYVGSVAGTALLAAMIPKGAVASDFALLLVPVAVVAAANLVACLSVRKVDLVGT